MITTGIPEINSLDDLVKIMSGKALGELFLTHLMLEYKLNKSGNIKDKIYLEFVTYFTHTWFSPGTEARAQPAATKSADLLIAYLDKSEVTQGVPHQIIDAKNVVDDTITFLANNPTSALRSYFAINMLFLSGIGSALTNVKSYLPLAMAQSVSNGMSEENIKRTIKDNMDKAVSLYDNITLITKKDITEDERKPIFMDPRYREMLVEIAHEEIFADPSLMDAALELGAEIGPREFTREGKNCRKFIFYTVNSMNEAAGYLREMDTIIKAYFFADDKKRLGEVKEYAEKIDFITKKFEKRLQFLTSVVGNIPDLKLRAYTLIRDTPILQEHYPIDKQAMHVKNI